MSKNEILLTKKYSIDSIWEIPGLGRVGGTLNLAPNGITLKIIAPMNYEAVEAFKIFHETKELLILVGYGYDLELMSPEIENKQKEPEKSKVYVKLENGAIKYIVAGMKNCEKIEQKDFPEPIPSDDESLKDKKQKILEITSKRGHTLGYSTNKCLTLFNVQVSMYPSFALHSTITLILLTNECFISNRPIEAESINSLKFNELIIKTENLKTFFIKEPIEYTTNWTLDNKHPAMP